MPNSSLRRRAKKKWTALTLVCVDCRTAGVILDPDEHANLVLWLAMPGLVAPPRAVTDGGRVTSGQMGKAYLCPDCATKARDTFVAVINGEAK